MREEDERFAFLSMREIYDNICIWIVRHGLLNGFLNGGVKLPPNLALAPLAMSCADTEHYPTTLSSTPAKDSETAGLPR